MKAWLERRWYRDGLWCRLLMPLSVLMAVLVWLRRKAYHIGIFSSWRAPLPVIVVGNITVGGTGKTPLVLWLVDFLKARGWHPGIISRGYGGTATGVREVHLTSNPADVGDEPLLMARRAGCPVFIGRNRPEAAKALLGAHPECDVLISDDGLQHYALVRDVEIVVVDGVRLYGNGALIPVGPMREPLGRLGSVDAVVINGGNADSHRNEYGMVLRGDEFHNLSRSDQVAAASAFAGRRLHAVAGIGNPARFFNHLRMLGLDVVEHLFPDHHPFQAADLQIEHADAILMTEKDAVKCFSFAPDNAWYLPVQAEVLGGLGDKVLKKLSKVK